MSNLSSVPIPGSSGSPEDATDFIGSLATAVAPFLVLFGELATKQFLSLSMGWADDVLLAMGPIGIITIVASTIRIGGFRWLKAVIGRAREGPAMAELEFLSSTSNQVCELWSGDEVIRLNDNLKARTIETIVITRSDKAHRNIRHVGEAVVESKLFQKVATGSQQKESRSEHGSLGSASSDEVQSGTDPEAAGPEVSQSDPVGVLPPNLTLNIEGTSIPGWEIWIWATIGLLLQAFALAFPAIATYHFKWQRKGQPVLPYAYPLFASGLIATTIGLLFCGRTIEAATDEVRWEWSDRGDKETVEAVVHMQKACVAATHSFQSCAIRVAKDTRALRVSSLDERDSTKWYRRVSASVASLLAIVGFILQVIGLSILHFSATITMLAVGLTMALIRVWVRRGLAFPPECLHAPEDHELAWLACRASKGDWIVTESKRDYCELGEPDCQWGLPTGVYRKLHDLTDSKDGQIQVTLRNGESYFIANPAGSRLKDRVRQLLDSILCPTDGEFKRFPLYEGGIGVAYPTVTSLEYRLRYLQVLDSLVDESFMLGFWPEDVFGDESESTLVRLSRQAMQSMPALLSDRCEQLGSNLATAMFSIMRILDLNVTWKSPQAPWLISDWIIDVKGPGRTDYGKPVTRAPWIIKKKTLGNKQALSAELARGLSLWFYSLRCWDTIMEQLYDIAFSEDVTISKPLGHTPTGHVRVVGHETWCSEQSMKVWIPSKEFRTMNIDGNAWTGLEPLFPVVGRDTNRVGMMEWKTPVHEWNKPVHVFGIYHSARFE